MGQKDCSEKVTLEPKQCGQIRTKYVVCAGLHSKCGGLQPEMHSPGEKHLGRVS